MSDVALHQDLLRDAVLCMPADPLTPVRRAALADFAARGFPTVRHEDWRYTSLAAAIERSNTWLREDARSDGEQQAALPDALIDAYWITIAGGIATHVPAELGELGIAVSRLCETGADGDIETGDAMSSFNAMLLRDGLKLTVAPGIKLDKPVGFFVTDAAGPRVRLSQVRIIVEAGENSHIRLLENYPDSNAPNGFTNTVVQLRLAPHAQVDYVRLQDSHPEHIQIGRLLAHLERESAFHYFSLDFGGALVRNDVAVDIAGAAASTSLHGLYLADRRQHIDNHTRVDHRVGPANSTEEYRGILSGRARCIFNGKAIVHAGADGTDAHQANHNLLLSPQAEVDTKPELEIYADDVKCSHGATVGQLDRSALFYLRSRGLDREHAARVLTEAFAAGILSNLPIAAARDAVEKRLRQRLQQITTRNAS